MDGNTAGYYGAAVLARKAQVEISGSSSFTNHTGTTGAALYFRDGCSTTLKNISVNDNTSRMNGVIYTNSGTLTMDNVSAAGNEAINGGVLYISGSTTQVAVTNSTWSGNTADYGGVRTSREQVLRLYALAVRHELR